MRILLSLIAPVLVYIFRPLGMDTQQAIVVGTLVLVVTWWSAGIVNKLIASCLLLAVFALFSGAPPKTVFTFLISENFPLIALTYLFSRGISNSGLIEKLFQPFLGRFARTPFTILLCMIATFAVTIYMVPQPLARLIIVAMLFDNYMRSLDMPSDTKEVLMVGCFIFYALVNMSTRNADMIMNFSTLSFAGLSMSDMEWAKYMALPTLVYGVLMVGLFALVFRRQMFIPRPQSIPQAEEPDSSLHKQDKIVLAIIAVTVLLWMTSSLHGINSTVVTLAATAAMFAVGVLKLADFDAIDVTTLVFLAAAFSIGGVMKACGAADVVFSRLKCVFPAEYSIWYILIMAVIGKAMHLVLGSNTTTLSLIIPGLMLMCSDVLSPEAIMFTAYVSVAVHSILPFHSVALMIGNAKGYFSPKYVVRFGLPMTVLLFIAILFVYLPWWRITGIL